MKTYHIITIGCQMNKSDSERLACALEKRGYKWTENKYKADLVAVNTCGVRQSAEDRVYGLIPEIKRKNKKAKIIVTGCLEYREDVRRRLAKFADEWLPMNKIFNFPWSSQDKQFSKSNFQTNAQGEDDYLKIIPKYESKFSAFVPIGNGCDNFCSYCVVPYARGREVWRPAGEILKEVKNLVSQGYKEIILIAQNVNSYKSGKIDFADLLKMANKIPGEFWIRFLTNHPKDMSDKLIKAMTAGEKVCRHVHLPAQAGDNQVLKKMNRKYKYDDYVKLVGKIRKVMPGAAITTDIIVGFCGETKKQFDNTVKLMKQVKFDMAYVAQYTPRPGTAAYKLVDDVPKPEKKKREEELMKILRKTALEKNKKYIGKTIKTLVEGRSKKGGWLGKTETGKMVEIVNLKLINKNLAGKFVKMKIKKVRGFGLEG